MVIKYIKALFLVFLGVLFFPYSLIALGVFLAFQTYDHKTRNNF